MKKMIFIILAVYLNCASATTIQLSGLDKVNKARDVNIALDLNWGDCSPSNWNCSNENMSIDLPKERFNEWLSSFNQESMARQYQKNINGKDSTISFKFNGYPNSCNLILTNKNLIKAFINQDGSCNSN